MKLTTQMTPGNKSLLLAQSCPTLCGPKDCSAPRRLGPWGFPGQDTGVVCHFLLQGIFLTQGSNPDMLHCPRQNIYHMHDKSHSSYDKYLLLLYLCAKHKSSS